MKLKPCTFEEAGYVRYCPVLPYLIEFDASRSLCVRVDDHGYPTPEACAEAFDYELRQYKMTYSHITVRINNGGVYLIRKSNPMFCEN